MSEAARTPAQIEADITRRRQDLALVLDEIAVRVHPQTIIQDTKAKAVSAVDRAVGQAYVAANRTANRVRAHFVDEDGSVRVERVVPAAVAGAALLGAVAGLTVWRRRR
ncbi:DUF3618 domain-containing protein [Actinacidiphila yeochonensis]|uniref:DUF3618 domain-containing protein n=1 Tax=Actinacidiphila yeochonensis TaxID=89050 RepID=UPI0005624376|nr:DUF3618 domain-containing protein [Actinacidiphila yeochonensis]